MNKIRFDHRGRWTSVPAEGAARAEDGAGPPGSAAAPSPLPTAQAPGTSPLGAAPLAHAAPPPGWPATGAPHAPSIPPSEAPPAEAGPQTPFEPADPAIVRERAVRMIETVYDPEIPVNIYELGLIYDVLVDESGHVNVKMTLTSPGCFAAQVLPGEVRTKLERVPGVRSAKVDIVWDPPWNPSLMSDAAKLQLNMLW